MRIAQTAAYAPSRLNNSPAEPQRWTPRSPDGFDAGRSEPVSLGGGAPTQTAGEQALELARSVMGTNAHDLKLANDTALGAAMQDWVPDNVNCANFISGLLVSTGQITPSEGSASVTGLISRLRQNPGFTETDLDHAQPGDVVAFEYTRRDGTIGRHVVMFDHRDESGKPVFIGSNNVNADGTQRVSLKNGVPSSWRVMSVMHNGAAAGPGATAPSAPTSVESITTNRMSWLRMGSRGPAVEDLQRRLAAAGFDPGPINGTFTAKTDAAVRAYQKANHLMVDGIVGPQTRGSLLGTSTTPAANGPATNTPAQVNAPPPPPGSETAPSSGATLDRLPPRAADAMTGSQFLEATKGLSRAEREAAILREVLAGNVPSATRELKEVTVQAKAKDGTEHTVKLRVIPDYVQIGSDADSVRIPMSPQTAQRIADATGTSLPTRKMVDTIYQQADVKLQPQPLPPGAQMMSNGYYAEHDRRVDAQLQGAAPGSLVAGDKKDLILSNAIESHPDRVIIYGWHQQNGKPIQPLSWIHEASYADYSHGTRLVSGTVELDGKQVPLADVLKDPNLAPLLSDEGALRSTRYPG